jgi:hypothetical protein
VDEEERERRALEFDTCHAELLAECERFVKLCGVAVALAAVQYRLACEGMQSRRDRSWARRWVLSATEELADWSDKLQYLKERRALFPRARGLLEFP